jgi:hypothetical protein
MSSTFRELLEAQGLGLVNQYPERHSPYFWLQAGVPKRDQGWKLHISCRADRIPELISQVGPILSLGSTFKLVSTQAMASAINNGMAGTSQVGKILTVYPADDQEAYSLGDNSSRCLRVRQAP